MFQDNAKLLLQLRSGFKRTIYQNKYQSKVTIQGPSPYLDFLIFYLVFQGVNRLFYGLKIKMIKQYTQNIIF